MAWELFQTIQDVSSEELALIGPSTRRWVPEILEANDPNDVSFYPNMNGQLVFKNAVVRFSEVIEEGLQHNQLSTDQIDMLIPHQANLRISQFIQKKFGLYSLAVDRKPLFQ